MYMNTEKAIEMYHKACQAEQQGNPTLAEVYYLKSWSLFEQAGGEHYLNAASALNALALLRRSRGNLAGAFRSAKQSSHIMQTFGAEYSSAIADSIRATAAELIQNLSPFQNPA